MQYDPEIMSEIEHAAVLLVSIDETPCDDGSRYDRRKEAAGPMFLCAIESSQSSGLRLAPAVLFGGCSGLC